MAIDIGLAGRGGILRDKKRRAAEFSGPALVKRTVDIFELARTGGQVEAQIAVDQMPRLASLLARTEGQLRCRLRGRLDEHGRSAAVLQLQGLLGLTCDRCGKMLDWPLEADADLFFVADPAELDAIPITADGDEPLLGSRHFDWWDLAEDQAILSLPISPRHDRCERGQLPAADGEDPRRPFAALEVLKKGRTVVK
jgi:uncharacterized protein